MTMNCNLAAVAGTRAPGTSCVWLFLVLALSAAACASDDGPSYNHCTKDSDCLPAGVCIDGLCGSECVHNNQCPGKTTCIKYRCRLPAPPADVPQQPEEVTVTDVADLTDEPEVDIGPDQDLSPPEDTPVEDVNNTDEGLAPGCEPTQGPYGAACSCKEECASALCVVNKIINTGQCTQLCTNDNQCPQPDVCVIVDDTGICVPNDSGQPSSCDPAENYCYKQLVAFNKINQCVCTAPCITKADCPTGFACHADNQVLIKYCVSVGEMCATGYVPCFGECAGDPSVGQGFCTALCVSTADCPDDWTCTPIGGGLSICNPG